MMTTTPATTKRGDHLHAVRFYQDSDSLARLVSEFIGEGFQASLPAIVIATPEHREAIGKHLQAKGFDVGRLEADGALFLLDAQALLSRIMVDGMPESRLFRNALIPIIETACKGREDCVIRAYGEMVDVLWKADQTVAAVRLETLWNELAQTHAFSLLCGYSMGNFYKGTTHQEICSHHTHVLSDSGEAQSAIS